MNDSDRRHHLQHRLYEAEATITRLQSALATARREALDALKPFADEGDRLYSLGGRIDYITEWQQHCCVASQLRALLSQSVEVGPTSSGNGK